MTVNLAHEAWLQDAAVQRVFALLNADGGEGRVVGGAVRNALMGAPISDVDFATTNLPQVVMERAAAAGIKAVPTGIDHGTVTLVIDGRGFEVTTLRQDVETDGRRAKVSFGTDWQADAERRDFTINALYATADGDVVDLVNGLPDIETKTLRFIGDAHQRIAEDYLRVLRFFRFFAYCGSGRPDADGLRASARAKDKLDSLSAERVWSELRKLLAAPDPSRALLWMRTSGVLTAVLPETEKMGHRRDPWSGCDRDGSEMATGSPAAAGGDHPAGRRAYSRDGGQAAPVTRGGGGSSIICRSALNHTRYGGCRPRSRALSAGRDRDHHAAAARAGQCKGQGC